MAKAATLLFKGRPLRQLTRGATKTGGRNNQGRVTSFHRGGGAKQSIREIDMKRSTPGLTGIVERIEYDPFRTGRTALIRWEGERPPRDGRSEGGEEDGLSSAASKKRRIKDMQRSAFPRGVHDLSRRMLRSAVARICGVPTSVHTKGKELLTVTIDGRKRYTSLARDGGDWGAETSLVKLYQDLTMGNRHIANKMLLKDTKTEPKKENGFEVEKKTKTTWDARKGIAAFVKEA